MKDFNNMTEHQLKNVLTFTSALADRIEQDGQINFGEMTTTNESLDEVEKSAREFAERRKAGLIARSGYGETTDEQAEVDAIREGIKEFYKRTGKVVKG